MAIAKSSQSPVEEQIHLSGTQVHQMQQQWSSSPVELTHLEIAKILVASMSRLKASSHIP